MAVIVQKYGGSSVAGAARLRDVARRIVARRAAGDELVIVVSAMGDTTDELLRLAREVSDSPPRRELDMLLTAGERIAMALLSMALHELGVPAISFTGSQSGILTNDSHTSARIVEVRPYRIQDELARGRVVIVAGYQGVSYRREVTTLGRGGSDTTAVALAAALGAEACEIYSDVDGVFSGDPRVVPQARRLAEISYEEMQTLAECGARVLNPQAVEFARRAGITIHARATAGGEGTVVGPAPAGSRVAGVAGQSGLVSLTLPSPAGLEELLEFLEAAGASPRDTAAGPAGASLLLSLENLHDFASLREALSRRFPGSLSCREGLGAAAVVGAGVNADAGHLRRGIAALTSLAVPLEGVLSGPMRLLFLVAEPDVPACVRRLHAEFLE